MLVRYPIERRQLPPRGLTIRPTPGATTSGFRRLLPSTNTGPRLLKPAIDVPPMAPTAQKLPRRRSLRGSSLLNNHQTLVPGGTNDQNAGVTRFRTTVLADIRCCALLFRRAAPELLMTRRAHRVRIVSGAIGWRQQPPEALAVWRSSVALIHVAAGDPARTRGNTPICCCRRHHRPWCPWRVPWLSSRMARASNRLGRGQNWNGWRVPMCNRGWRWCRSSQRTVLQRR